MNILVTGSSGFIGSRLCSALLRAGHHVRAFHRPSSSLLALLGQDVEHVLGDITQPATLTAAMQGVEVVFHAAATVGVKKPARLANPITGNFTKSSLSGSSQRFPAEYAATVNGTRNVMKAARESGVRRVIHTSSAAALGVPDSFSPEALSMDENHTWNFSPRWWPYGYTKYLAEMEAQYAVAKGLDVVIVNPTVVIGAGDLNRVSGDIIIHMARGHIPFSPPGGLNLVHIDDVVRGHLAALVRGQTGQRYILGGENLAHHNFLHLIAEIAHVPPPRWIVPGALLRLLARPLSWLDGRVSLPTEGSSLRRAGYYFYYDTAKARSVLGLGVPLPSHHAIQEALDWYNQQGML